MSAAPIALTSRLVGLLASLGDGTDPESLLATDGNLSGEARIFVGLMGVGAVVFILLLLRRRQLRGKYALVWTGLAVVLGVLGLFPGLLNRLADAVGIFYPPALFLLVATGFLFAVVIQFSWELSRLEDRSRVLAEEMALIHAELADLRSRLADGDENGDGTAPGAGDGAEVDPVGQADGTPSATDA